MKKNRGRIERLTYIIIVLWVALGMLGFFYQTNFQGLTAYFLSLTGFIGIYAFGQTKRKSNSTPLFSKGPNSRREITIYITILLWLIIGVFGILSGANLADLAGYFAALSPIVGAYILGETFSQEKMNSDRKRITDTFPEETYDNVYFYQNNIGPSIHDYKGSKTKIEKIPKTSNDMSNTANDFTGADDYDPSMEP